MGGRGVFASRAAPPGAAWLVKHSCHFVHLKVGLLTPVEKRKGGRGLAVASVCSKRGVGDYFKGAC